MRFLGFLALGSIISLSITSCGSSDDDSRSSKEFARNVDRVPYSLAKVTITAEIGNSSDKAAEKLQKQITKVSTSKDQVQRLIKGTSFILVMNDKESPLEISSAGNIDHHQSIQEKNPSCELNGFSKVSGEATTLELDFEWTLSIDLNGEACENSLVEKYLKFQDAELDVFNLNAVRKVLSSSDLDRSEQRHIRLSVKVSGDSN